MSVVSQVRRFYDEIWNIPDLSVVPEVLHPEVTFRGSLGSARRGHEEFESYVASVTAALGSYRCDLDALVAAEGAAAARLRFSGLHRGSLLGHAPTGRAVTWAGAAFFRFDGELMVDIWVLGDLQSLVGQLAAAR